MMPGEASFPGCDRFAHRALQVPAKNSVTASDRIAAIKAMPDAGTFPTLAGA